MCAAENQFFRERRTDTQWTLVGAFLTLAGTVLLLAS